MTTEVIWGFIVIAVVIAILIMYVIGLYNKLVMLSRNTEKFYANIDVLLKQRADEIPNLVAITKEVMRYEEKTLIQLTQLRANFLAAKQVENKVKIGNRIAAEFKTIFAICEQYPELKATQSLLNLQKRISHLENCIADRREFYNDSVNLYNIGIGAFPNVLLAKMIGYKEKSMLEIIL